jgi:hypothetical protein
MNMNCFTQLWTVKLGDFERGLIIAVLTTPLTIIYQSVTATPVTLTFNWTAIIGGAIAGGIAYVAKNFMTGSGGKLLTNDPSKTGF